METMITVVLFLAVWLALFTAGLAAAVYILARIFAPATGGR